MNAYILRAKPHGYNRENEFLDGRISVGWPCGRSLEGLDRKGIASILSTAYDSLSEVSISMVDLFVHMPEGSIVLTPSIEDKTLIHIFKTISTYKYNAFNDNQEQGNPHFIEVEYLKTVSRSTLPSSVLRSLSGARKTLSRISQHFGILEDYITAGFETDSENIARDEEARIKAINVLYDLLSSEDENIRLKAAVAIINLP